MQGKVRPLTKEESELWSRAHKVLSSPIEPGTNITILSYILDGKTEELEELIRQAETGS